MDRSLAVNRLRWRACGAVGLMLLVTLAGCGSESVEVYDKSDEGILASMVSSVVASGSEAPSEIARWERLFPEGAAPADAEKEKYAANGSYWLVPRSSTFTGDTATAKVEVEDKDEKILGEMDWKFAKVGGKWKIKEAPLP